MASHTSASVREETPHANQTTSDAFDFSQTDENSELHFNKERIEALAEMICAASEESAGALFVLMGMMEDSQDSKMLAHTAKHLAFTRCGELNLFGMVDAQIEAVEAELFSA